MLPNGLDQPGSRAPVTYAKVLLVEGKSAFEFFKALLRRLQILDQVEIRNYGGVDQLPNYLRTLPAIDGFRRVTSLGIIRDAESNATAAFNSVHRAMEKAQSVKKLNPRLVVPSAPEKPCIKTSGIPSVSVFILPDCRTPGMLETLCLDSVRNDPALQCVEEYSKCLVRSGFNLGAKSDKAKLHTFLASRLQPDLLLGQAAHEGYFPWESPAFESIKAFLMAL